jgi:hypothetical protein
MTTLAAATRPKYRILLTVGDGDLSLSLALVRAYGDQVQVTATKIHPTATALVDMYPHAASIILQELESYSPNVTVLFGVDATQLPVPLPLI